ncbi:MAG: helix-hairpin-helix domain-containing protein, partial [Paludibacter sp.]|nr:helix-hairpin-helix domain-containing protein [Paludibacter sp.]
ALQDVTYAFEKIPLKFDLRYMMFDAADYENRFYTYEKDVLYAFSIPSFYGQGSRFYCNMRYELSDNFSLWFKFSQTIYADGRETIGTGLEMSKGNRRSDFRVMLKWNF